MPQVEMGQQAVLTPTLVQEELTQRKSQVAMGPLVAAGQGLAELVELALPLMLRLSETQDLQSQSRIPRRNPKSEG